jgi:hypothetical protein
MTTDITNEKSPSVIMRRGIDTILNTVPRMRLTTASTTANKSADIYQLLRAIPPTGFICAKKYTAAAVIRKCIMYCIRESMAIEYNRDIVF